MLLFRWCGILDIFKLGWELSPSINYACLDVNWKCSLKILFQGFNQSASFLTSIWQDQHWLLDVIIYTISWFCVWCRWYNLLIKVIVNFKAIFSPFTTSPNDPKNQNFEKNMKKIPGDIIILHIHVYHEWRSYDIWFLKYKEI